MVSNNANNVNLKENGKDQSKCSLTYHVSSSSFTMTQQDDRLFPKGSEVILIKPPFKLFVTGNLSYYADVLGVPNSSSYWCTWCLLSHAEWNQPPDTVSVEELATQFLSEVSLESWAKILSSTTSPLTNGHGKSGI